MRIFVTGMTGFLGHELGQILLKKGHKLGTLARNVATSDRPIASNTESMIRGEKQSGISYFYGDLTDYLNIFDVLSTFKPDVIIYIDYPGFNLRIAKWAHKNGYKNHYYISPQVWAWKENRIKTIKKNIDYLYVILPF